MKRQSEKTRKGKEKKQSEEVAQTLYTNFT